MSDVRRPAAAGQFYEGSREGLSASLRECFLHPLGPGSLPELNPQGPAEIDAVVSPHAGYVFSGPAAAHGFSALAADGVPEVVIILGPSHYMAARQAAVSLADAWRTPLGDAPIDTDLGRRLLESTALLEENEQAHRDEHSLEVQVPFLQFIYADRLPKMVPICLRSYPSRDIESVIADADDLGRAIAEAVGTTHAVVVASTDFSHQVPHEVAEREDRHALNAIEALDAAGLLRTVYSRRISMCGPVPVAAAISYCRARGAQRAEMLRYYTSGDILGDRHGVVGYASFVIRRQGGGSR